MHRFEALAHGTDPEGNFYQFSARTYPSHEYY